MADVYYGTTPQELADLNKALHRDDSKLGECEMSRGAIGRSLDGSVQAYFTDIENRLIDFIDAAEIVVGCVAWVTSKRVIEALARCDGVSIIIQKEDFLRPDTVKRPDWARWLRQLYESARGMERYDLPSPISALSYCGDPTMQAFRCVGLRNGSQDVTSPRCHHKFVLACHFEDGTDGYNGQHLIPDSLWTGSYNFTVNATRSFENALVINEPLIVAEYLIEWAQIAALSEPLDWESEWVAPEWRIGS